MEQVHTELTKRGQNISSEQHKAWLWHWEAKQGLPLLTLTSSSRGRSIPGCFSTAQALHSHSSAITVCRVGNGGHFHISSLHSSGWSEMAQKGLSWRAQHPSSSVSWDFYSQETDRSESKKQRLQIRRLTALIWQVLSAQKRGISVILKTFSPITCNSNVNLGHIWMEAG